MVNINRILNYNKNMKYILSLFLAGIRPLYPWKQLLVFVKLQFYK